MSHGIDHVVVMAMENRSFDHLLGFFTNIIPGLRGLQGNETNPGDQGSLISVKAADVPTAYTRAPDPGHEPDNVARQLFGMGAQVSAPGGTPANNGFVLDYAQQRDDKGPIGGVRAGSIMECFTSPQLPGVTALATAGVVCDNWFAAVPGPTWPNRFYIHCGTSGGINTSPSNGDIFNAIEGNRPYDFPTIYEALDRVGATWRIYYENVSQSMALQYVGDRYEDSRECFGDMYGFVDDCRNGSLANYNFIEPKQWAAFGQCNDMHPPHDVRLGDDLITTVYRALSQGPAWNQTLFVLMFDEHGGFYDHVPPPGALDPATPPDVRRLIVNPDGKIGAQGFNFDRFGVRIPCILTSPLLATIGPDHTTYDHSSLVASIRKMFGISTPLGKRDEVANDFLHLLQDSQSGLTQRVAQAAAAAPPITSKPLAPPSYEESLVALNLHFNIHHHHHPAARAPTKKPAKSEKKTILRPSRPKPRTPASKRRRRG